MQHVSLSYNDASDGDGSCTTPPKHSYIKIAAINKSEALAKRREQKGGKRKRCVLDDEIVQQRVLGKTIGDKEGFVLVTSKNKY